MEMGHTRETADKKHSTCQNSGYIELLLRAQGTWEYKNQDVITMQS